MQSEKQVRKPNLEGEIFDDHFAGRYVSMTKWLAECIILNFADFLGDKSLDQLVGDLTKEGKERFARRFPTASTGSSGES
jgi:hypothetical protein